MIPHSDDPLYRQARRLYVEPGSGNDNARLMRRLGAARVMQEIERWDDPASGEQRDRMRDRLAVLLDDGGAAS